MTNNNWRILEAAFATATSLEDDAREQMLATFAADHPDLEQRLRNLLAADSEDDQPISQPIARSARELAESAIDPWEHRQLGAWTIQRRIANGGMGAVFLAERSDEQYQQTAALKIMTAQILAKDAVARFRAERQILASLNHPNIAKLIDGGSTDEQLPYLVMEYVDGRPIDRYCDDHQLSISERLVLFNKVCDAVDFAHRNLIVHRDLKPNNILVGQDGEPKLLDFGIAKLLESHSSMQTIAITRQGTALMTPEYASPEQVRGESISVATDVFSLGVLLYQLLTGQSPYGDAISSPKEIERAIVETDPKRPSTVVTSSDEISSNRRSSPSRLRKRLNGDLDNIVMMAMRKEPENRYATVRQFSEDVENFLTRNAVLAHPPSWRYRSSKFLRRNAIPVVTAAFFVATIVSLATFYTLQLKHERDQIQIESNKATQVADFLEGLFENVSPRYGPAGQSDSRREVTARDLLDHGWAEMQVTLQDQPEIRAHLLEVMGHIYFSVDDLDQAKKLVGEAIHLLEAQMLNGRYSRTIVKDYCGALITASWVHRARGEWPEAQAVNDRCLESIQMLPDPAPDMLIAHHHSLAYLYSDLGEFDRAEALFLQTVEFTERRSAADPRKFIQSLSGLGNLYVRSLRPRDARTTYERALQVAKAALGNHNPTTIGVRMDLAGVLSGEEIRAYDEAEKLLQQSLISLQRLYTHDHVLKARGYATIASFYRMTGQHQLALENQRESIRIFERVRGPLSGETLNEKADIGHMYYLAGDFDAAEGVITEVLRQAEAAEPYAKESVEFSILQTFGSLREDQGNYVEAERIYRRAMEIGENRYGADSPYMLVQKENVAWAVGNQGRFDEGDRLYRELLTVTGQASSGVLPEELGRLAETYAEWLDMMQRPKLAANVREEWATQIEVGKQYIDSLTRKEEERIRNADNAKAEELEKK